ncbi:MAG: sigma-70 family RNA polymerase sigma factor [Bacteroidota bacterium]
MEVTTPTEEELIKQARKDPSRFEPVYNKYFEEIFHFINKRTNNQDITFDITQQVFFNALNSIGTYKHKGYPFSSFLYKIAINECNKYFRDRTKVRYISIASDSIEVLSEEVDFDEGLKEALLEKALGKLKNQEVILIELRFFEKRSFREIASILEIKETNAKVRLHRIIKKMKKIINDEK